MDGNEVNGQGEREQQEPGLFSDSRLMKKKSPLVIKCLKIKITK